MKTTKPTFKKINPEFGSSLVVRQHTEKIEGDLPFWHFHPEVEMVYVNKGKGRRHIGNHLSYFNNSQLILIGSNLPHNGFTDRLTSKGKESLKQAIINYTSDKYGIDIDHIYIQMLNIKDKLSTYDLIDAMKKEGCCNK